MGSKPIAGNTNPSPTAAIPCLDSMAGLPLRSLLALPKAGNEILEERGRISVGIPLPWRTPTLGSFPSLSCPSQTPLGRIPTAQKRGSAFLEAPSQEGGCVLLECCSWTPNPAVFPPKMPGGGGSSFPVSSDPREKLHHDPALLSRESWKEMDNWDFPVFPDSFLVSFPAVCGR